MRRWDPRDFPRGDGRIFCTIEAPSAEIVISSPRRRNAVSPGMMADLAEVVGRLEAQKDLSVVVIRGEGAAFCAGGDLRAVREHLLTPEAGAGMCDFMTAALDALAALPVVCIGAVTGPALGGGAELLTVCDVVYATPDAPVGFVHASLGVSPGWGGGKRLVARVGGRTALRLLTGAERLSGARAVDAGLVDVICADPLAEVAAHRDRLTSMPVAAVRAAVQIAKGAPEGPLFASLWGGEDHRAILKRVRAGQ
ncbi:MAG: ethylmalonyl-CoA/methylmalonyl-CoA decarboxylase [Myxococcota bacterium]|jgi:ethylmalonyl-CoA/methylmalonyl-CoA decarboxylase